MAFDINEARAIIEDAKKRGMIRTGGDADSAKGGAAPAASSQPAKETETGAVLPDWLQEGIRRGPLSRSDDESLESR